MIFIFGTRLFGKVDEVPGYFHVATEFFHIDYVPLFPVKSWIVTSQTGGQWNGVEMPICRKSMMLAWSRAGAIVCAIVALIVAAVDPNDHTQLTAVITTTMAVLAIMYTYKSKSFNHATFERACELARLARIPERTIQRYFDEAGMDTSASSDEQEPQPESGSAHFNPTESSQATFFVSGRNKENGNDVCITIWARNEVEARQQAIAKGIDVSAVEG